MASVTGDSDEHRAASLDHLPATLLTARELDSLFERLKKNASQCTDVTPFQQNDRNDQEKLLRKAMQFKFDRSYQHLADELTKFSCIDYAVLRLILGSHATNSNSSMQQRNQPSQHAQHELVFQLQNLYVHGMIQFRYNIFLNAMPNIIEQWRNGMIKDLEIRRCDERIFGAWHEHLWVEAAERWFGQTAAEIIRHICIHGFTSMSTLIKLCGSKQTISDDFLIPDGESPKRRSRPSNSTAGGTATEKILMRLLRSKLLSQVPQRIPAQIPEGIAIEHATLDAQQRANATLNDATLFERVTEMTSKVGQEQANDGTDSSRKRRTAGGSDADPLLTIEAARLNMLIWFDSFLHCKYPPMIFSVDEQRFLRCVFELTVLYSPLRKYMDIITPETVDKIALQQLMLEHYPGMEVANATNLIEFCMGKFSEQPGDAQVLGFLFTPGRLNVGKIAREFLIEIISRNIDHKDHPYAAKVFKFIATGHPGIISHAILEQRMVTNRDKINASLIWLIQKNLIMYKPVFKRENERFKGFRFCSTEYFVDLPVACRSLLDLFQRQLLRNVTFWEEHKTLCFVNEYTGSLIRNILAINTYLKLALQPNMREDESWQLGSTFTFLKRPMRKIRTPVSIRAMMDKRGWTQQCLLEFSAARSIK